MFCVLNFYWCPSLIDRSECMGVRPTHLSAVASLACEDLPSHTAVMLKHTVRSLLRASCLHVFGHFHCWAERASKNQHENVAVTIVFKLPKQVIRKK